jgi:EpsI family protein
MLSSAQPTRFWITAIVLIGATVLLHGVSHGETVVPHKPLLDLPHVLGTWHGEDHPLDAQVLQAVSVSDYANRLYVDQGGAAIQLYIGFYDSQRTGSTIHSPKNCLPGAGWDPVRAGDAKVSLPDGDVVTVNEYVVQQDQDRRMVFYWYQGRGRVVANEYSGKFWMVADAISRNRTDGALVRLVTSMNYGEANARARLTGFAQVLLPNLDEFIPK